MARGAGEDVLIARIVIIALLVAAIAGLRVLDLLVIIVFSVVVLHIFVHNVPTEVTRETRSGYFRGARSNRGRFKVPTM